MRVRTGWFICYKDVFGSKLYDRNLVFALGLTNMSGYLFAALANPLLDRLIDTTGNNITPFL